MAGVAILSHEEGVGFDHAALARLHSDLGERGTNRVLRHATQELAERLAEVGELAEVGRPASLIRSAKLMQAVACQIGMTSLVRVIEDVIVTTARGDRAGQAATLARMARVGDRSLKAFRQVRDRIG